MTGSATSAAAAIKDFFINNTPQNSIVGANAACGFYMPSGDRVVTYQNHIGTRALRDCGIRTTVFALSGQSAASHEAFVDRPGALPALPDGPNDQGLPSTHISGCKKPGDGSAVIPHARRHV